LEGSWHAVLRDIMVILAAASVISTALFAGLVAWQLYRLAKEMRDEAQPIIDSVETTAKTVQGTAEFVNHRTVPPVVTAVGLGSTVFSVYRQLQMFYRGIRTPVPRSTKIRKG
jgi:archaellum component FlaG (FlaF/FlaG flagellin family)